MCSSVVKELPNISKTQDSNPIIETNIQHPSKNMDT